MDAVALVTALAALIVAGVTFSQLKQAKFSLGVDLMLKMEDRFESDSMCRKRAAAARAFLRGASTPEGTEEVEEVLDFFETVSLLERKKALDREMVWNSFSHWILGWGAVAMDHIVTFRKREKDDSYYEDFLSLHAAMLDIARNRNIEPPSVEGRQRFLRQESELDSAVTNLT